MKLPSKELLGEVFTNNQQSFKVISVVNNMLYYSWLDETPFGEGDVNCKWVDFEINIYELAHKCKEWAEEYGYTILSTINGGIGIAKLFDIKDALILSVMENTESEAIFKACQWILDNKETK